MKNLVLYLVIGGLLIGGFVFRNKIKAIISGSGGGINIPGIPNTAPSSEDLKMVSVDFNECVKERCNGPCYTNYNAKGCMSCQAKNCKSVAKSVSREMENKFTAAFAMPYLGRSYYGRIAAS